MLIYLEWKSVFNYIFSVRGFEYYEELLCIQFTKIIQIVAVANIRT